MRSAERLIDEHLARLDRALVGSARAKAGLLREARDGVLDDYHAAMAAGLPAPVAAAQAVQAFGSVQEVAPAFQRELAMSDLRRSSLLVAAVLLAQPVVWSMVATDTRAASLFAALDAAAGWLAAAVLGVALLAALACGIGLRYVAVGGRTLAIGGGVLLGACPVFAGLGIAMWAATDGGLPTFALLTGVLLLPLAAVAAGARRCLRTA